MELLGGTGLYDELFVLPVVADRQFIGTTTDLAIFNIGLRFALRRIDKGSVALTTVGAIKGRLVGMFGSPHGWDNIKHLSQKIAQ